MAAAQQPAAGKQVEQDFVAAGQSGVTARYLLFLPTGYGKAEQQWPLILFLHGRGESNGPLSLVKKWGPPRLVELVPEEFPYIVVSPQCPADESWKEERQQQILDDLLDDICHKYAVDPTRIYLTGLSMGGYGCWTWAARHAERFAAVVPICGGGDPAAAEQLKSLPIWVFHGTEDKAVPLAESQRMVDAIHQAGGSQVRFTTMEAIGHNSWSAAYATPELYSWLNTHTAKRK